MTQNIKTPWGISQYIECITPWLFHVSTCGHGGVKVDKAYNSLIPAKIRRKSGWYEEDCEWCIAYCFLEKFIKRDSTDEHALKVIENKIHIDTFKQWYPQSIDLLKKVC